MYVLLYVLSLLCFVGGGYWIGTAFRLGLLWLGIVGVCWFIIGVLFSILSKRYKP